MSQDALHHHPVTSQVSMATAWAGPEMDQTDTERHFPRMECELPLCTNLAVAHHVRTLIWDHLRDRLSSHPPALTTDHLALTPLMLVGVEAGKGSHRILVMGKFCLLPITSERFHCH